MAVLGVQNIMRYRGSWLGHVKERTETQQLFHYKNTARILAETGAVLIPNPTQLLYFIEPHNDPFSSSGKRVQFMAVDGLLNLLAAVM